MPLILLLFASCLTSKQEYLEYRMALLDQDGDGYVWDHFPEEGGDDCDDFNASINPGTAEVPYNGRDDDCNAATVDDDLDDDGYPVDVDCNDRDAGINPGAVDVGGDGVDQDCSGSDFSVSHTADAGASAGWGEPLPTPQDIGAAGGTGSTGGGADGGGEGSTWTEWTQYTGRVRDVSRLLEVGDPVEIGIWRARDILEEPPSTASALARVERAWDGEQVRFTLGFELEAGSLETCEVYAISDRAGYVSSGSFPIEAGEWITDQELVLGEDAPRCAGSTDHPKESAICGTVTDETGMMRSGKTVWVEAFEVADPTAEVSELDLNELAVVAGAEVLWDDAAAKAGAADFITRVVLYEDRYVFLALRVELGDGDPEPDLLGRGDVLFWRVGTDVMDVTVSMTDYIP